MQKLIDDINSPDDLKKLQISKLPVLAGEIRGILLNTISKTGGHLASNLGVVELTIALHYVFNSPKDKIVWDVGHQAYVHKILTGRKDCFKTLRQMGGISGFPKSSESEHDVFNTGHSSTSISAALGMAAARDIKGEKNKVIAIIGDGSMTGGLAYEALNNAGRSNRDLIVILNDNQMSIDKNVGALSRHLNDIRLAPAYLDAKEGVHKALEKVPFVGKSIEKAIEITKDKIKYLLIPGIMFEELGFKYIGDIDGHDIELLVDIFNKVKDMKGPVLLHIYTVKGKGYKFSEKLPCEYHGVSCFDLKTGKPIKSKKETYSDVFGKSMVEAAETNKNLVAVSAAMAVGTGLGEFSAKYPNRFFDVAIAEQHAVTFCAGLAKEGILPVFAVYSSFLQRAYDQIIHDVAMQNLHVIFAVDRAGIVGQDGETHQGVFDLSFLSPIPNMTIMAPSSAEELTDMLKMSCSLNSPVAIRYPKGTAFHRKGAVLEYGKGELMFKGGDTAIFSIGTMIETALLACDILNREGISVTLINARFMKPLDKDLIKSVIDENKYIFTIEDNLLSGGFGEAVVKYAICSGFKGRTHSFGFPDEFIEHGSQAELFKKYNLDAISIAKKMKEIIKEMDEA